MSKNVLSTFFPKYFDWLLKITELPSLAIY